MKKSFWKIAALATVLSVGTAGAIGLQAEAAEENRVQTTAKGGFAVLSGKGLENLKKTLEELGLVSGKKIIFCPQFPGIGIQKPELPDADTPDSILPEFPDTETDSDTNVDTDADTDFEIPGTKPEAKPEIPDQESSKPNTQKPETQNPEIQNPDVQEPESPNPESPEPELPNQPESPNQLEEPEDESPEAISYAQQVVKLVNEERAKAGLQPLTSDVKLTAAANIRAREIKQNFSHTRPDGNSFSTVLKEQNVSFRGSGENIAWGQRSPQEVMSSWMNSYGHRSNILDESYKNIGVGYYRDEQGRNHWVQLFTY